MQVSAVPGAAGQDHGHPTHYPYAAATAPFTQLSFIYAQIFPQSGFCIIPYRTKFLAPLLCFRSPRGSPNPAP